MSRHSVLGLSIIAVLAVAWALAGCGGSSSTTPVTPPVTGPAAVAGRVVRADSVGMGIPSAVISAPAVGVSTTADDSGYFKLTGLPKTPVTLTVTAPLLNTYSDATIANVPTSTDASPAPITVALLARASGDPVSVSINLQNVVMDLNADEQFVGTITGTTGTINASPTWVLDKPIGTIDASGHFQATAVGSATLTAVASATVVASTTITVRALTTPNITSVILSSASLPSSGGNLTVTAAANYGGGIESMTLEIITAKGLQVTVPMSLVTGDVKDGTYSAIYAAPANDNIPDALGQQAAQTYTARVIAAYVNTSGAAKTLSSSFQDFIVRGLDAPVPPPSS